MHTGSWVAEAGVAGHNWLYDTCTTECWADAGKVEKGSQEEHGTHDEGFSIEHSRGDEQSWSRSAAC
jgi:hypothetical protein